MFIPAGRNPISGKPRRPRYQPCEWLHIKRIENSGASVARNTAIEMCWDWADIIGVLDADDSYKPNKVEKLVEKLIEHPEVGVAYGDYDIHRNYGDKHYVKYESKAPYCRRELSQSCMVHSNALIKKGYLEKVVLPNGEIFDSRLHGPASQGFIGCTEDYDLWLRLSRYCVICHVPESLSIVNESGRNVLRITTPYDRIKFTNILHLSFPRGFRRNKKAGRFKNNFFRQDIWKNRANVQFKPTGSPSKIIGPWSGCN